MAFWIYKADRISKEHTHDYVIKEKAQEILDNLTDVEEAKW